MSTEIQQSIEIKYIFGVKQPPLEQPVAEVWLQNRPRF